MLTVPCTQTETGKRAFGYSARSAWSLMKNDLETEKETQGAVLFLTRPAPDLEADSIWCQCFSMPGCTTVPQQVSLFDHLRKKKKNCKMEKKKRCRNQRYKIGSLVEDVWNCNIGVSDVKTAGTSLNSFVKVVHFVFALKPWDQKVSGSLRLDYCCNSSQISCGVRKMNSPAPADAAYLCMSFVMGWTTVATGATRLPARTAAPSPVGPWAPACPEASCVTG